MRSIKKDNNNKTTIKNSPKVQPELNLDKAIFAIKQQSSNYHHAGLTHISSLLD